MKFVYEEAKVSRSFFYFIMWFKSFVYIILNEFRQTFVFKGLFKITSKVEMM